MTIASRKLRRWKKNPVKRCVLCGMAARHTGISHRCSANNYSEHTFAFEGQASERFANAVRLLNEPGADKLQVRIAGIYDLEKLAKQHPELYHQTVMEVLTSFIRMTVPNPPNDPLRKKADDIERESTHRRYVKILPGGPYDLKDSTSKLELPDYYRLNCACVQYTPPHPDIQLALTVVCQRDINWEQQHLPDYKLDLSQTNLSGANLMKANLQGAFLVWSNLEGADLAEANLSHALSMQVNLRGACLVEANMREADFCGSNLQAADIAQAEMYDISLRDADLSGANLSYSNLEMADFEYSVLERAFLHQANLKHTNLWNCNLRSAFLVWARLDDTDIGESDLTGAELSETDFSQVCRGMTREQFPEVLPEGMVLPRYLQEGYVPTPEEQKWLSDTGDDDCTKG